MNAMTFDSEPVKQEGNAAETARVFETGEETEIKTEINAGNGSNEKQNQSNPSQQKNLRFRVALAVAGVAAAAALTYAYENFVAPYESTDDAFIEGDATSNTALFIVLFTGSACHFSSFALAQLSRDILKACGGAGKLDLSAVRTVGSQFEVLSRLFALGLTQSGKGAGRLRFEPEKAGDDFAGACRQILHALDEIPAMVKPFEEKFENLACAGRRAGELSSALTSLIEQKDQSLVYWQEATQQGVFLNATPIEIGPILNEFLFSTVPTVVMTSATLSVAGAFDFVRKALGVPPGGRELLLHSPFDYERQTIAYIPLRFPAPNEGSFCARMAGEAAQIIEKTRGRALLLFTSYKNMHEVYRILEGEISFPLLVQGQKTKRALLQEFKDKVESVLFATSSFWQGIDVPGEALSCVIIDKLPFEVPDDPVTASRLDRIAKQGGNGFYEYQVPRAAIQLKQGIGRLIRSSGDHGVIALFDIRMLTKGYGQVFVKSLPPCRIVHSLDQIDQFLVASCQFPEKEFTSN